VASIRSTTIATLETAAGEIPVTAALHDLLGEPPSRAPGLIWSLLRPPARRPGNS